jgi:hypothetical protein
MKKLPKQNMIMAQMRVEACGNKKMMPKIRRFVR